jgi:tetratricopeptide (TPR) repeat protein
MVHYKNALSIALRAGKVEEAIEDKEKALENWIERLTREAERLIDVVDRLDEESEDDFEIIRAKIASAEAALDDASDLCENEEYDEALIKVKEARDTLKEVMDLIKPILKEVRKGMLEQFKLHLRERIEALEVDVGKMKNFLSGTKMSEALSRFGRAKGLINQAENRLRNSQDDEALDDLDEASQELDDGIDEFDDGYVQGLRGTNQIRAQVQILEQMAEQYQRKGKDASEILGKIEELEGVLDEGLALLFKGQAFGANGILDRLRRNGWFDGMNFRNGPTN